MPPQKSASVPTLGEPGSVWVWRGNSTLGTKKPKAEKPPENEASAVAWKAARKETLYGQLGTYNKISSVIQYPCSSKDPFNMAQGSRTHLSAEDRRLMRVMVKHSLRKSPHYPEAVYEVERKLVEGMGKNPHLKAAFFTNLDFANKTLAEMAYTVDTKGQASTSFDQPLELEGEARLIPGKHHYACGPQCFCLKFQDAALKVKKGDLEPGLFEESFAAKTQNAASTLVGSLAASRRKKHSSTS